MLPHYQHSNSEVERRSENLPESGGRPRHNQDSCGKQLHLWPGEEAEDNLSLGRVAWFYPKVQQEVLLD